MQYLGQTLKTIVDSKFRQLGVLDVIWQPWQRMCMERTKSGSQGPAGRALPDSSGSGRARRSVAMGRAQGLGPGCSSAI